MTNNVLNGALIGCGFFAQNHMHAWAGLPSAKITALCDTDPVRLAAMAKRFGITATYSDVHAMLAAKSFDFVDVATTVQSHRMLVEAVAPHVRLVICQKPFAETLEDAEAMVARCAAHDTKLLVHENFRWQQGLLAMRQLVDEGRIGTPRFGRFSFRHGYDNYVNQPYLLDVERFAIMDVGLHLFDVARWLMGEVVRLHCETQRRNPRVRGEDAFTAIFSHASGAVSVCDCSFASTLAPEPFPQVIAVMEGDSGTIELDRDYKLSLHRAGHVEVRSVEPPAPAWGGKPWHCVQDSVINLQRHAVDVLRGKSDPQPSGADNLKTLAIAIACYESAATGNAVAMKHFAETTT